MVDGFRVVPAELTGAAEQVGALAPAITAGSAGLSASVQAACAANLGYETSTALESLSAAVGKVAQQYAESLASQSRALTATAAAYQQNEEQNHQMFSGAL